MLPTRRSISVLFNPGQILNRTRQTILADEIAVADSHWSRLCGLLPVSRSDFGYGRCLWIIPCHGVHTLGMRFPLDAIYLDEERVVIHCEPHLKAWRIAPVRLGSASVLELPTGTLARTATAVGDTIEIRLQKGLLPIEQDDPSR